MSGTNIQRIIRYRPSLKDDDFLSVPPSTRPSLKQRLEALLILLCGAAIIVGACVWFFGYYLPAVDNQKEEPPPFKPAKPATPETFKPLTLVGGHGAFWCRRR
jgi:hypothetical protein